MSDSQHDEQQALEKYLAEKAKQDQEVNQQQEAESLSEYEACVLKESAKVRGLMAEAQREGQERSEDE